MLVVIFIAVGITSLEGSPEHVGGSFYCSNNKITSLEGCPKYIGGLFDCTANPIYVIAKYFILNKNKNNLIELFNYCDIIRGMDVIYDRLEYFYSEIYVKLSEYKLSEMKNEGYKIIR